MIDNKPVGMEAELTGGGYGWIKSGILAIVCTLVIGVLRIRGPTPRVGKLDEAIVHYEQALRLKPDSATVHNNLGNVLVGVGKTAEATSHYEEALRLNPDLAEAHYNLGVALRREGKINEALEHFERAVQINPDFVEARKRLAALQAEQAIAQPAR